MNLWARIGFGRRERRFLIPLLVWLLLTMGCSATDWVRRPEATAVPIRTLAPTFTPTSVAIQPLIIVTPPAGGTPGVIIVPPGAESQVIIPPAPTPEPSPTTTPEPPTVTPTPSTTPTFTPTPTATPFVEVSSGLLSLRTGPGVAYPLVAQLGPGIPVSLVGKNPEGTWYQICCVNGESVWVAVSRVDVYNDVVDVPLVAAGPPPTPTPTGTPTITPTPTPYIYAFQQAIGPQFFPTNNPFLTIWVKLYIGEVPTEVAAGGYYLEVRFEGFDRPNTNVERSSLDHFEFSSPPGAGNRVQYNYKYEYRPPDLSDSGGPTALEALGNGTWTIYVKDGAGNQLSESVTFTTAPWNPNREIYIGWQRIR